ncbi:MAG: SAV_6107 family HEPN domain-containing protein [Nocardioidaceae bacterium]
MSAPMSSCGLHPFDLPPGTYAYLERSAASLREAITTSEVPQRYAHAHVAALRATAALLAARANPVQGGARRGRSPQRNAWVLLAEVAPEFSEWAAFFAAGASKRAAAEAGSRRAVSEREADDLVRDADRFLALVEESLGLTRHVPFQEHLPLSPWRPERSSGKAPREPRGKASADPGSTDENAAGGRSGRHGRVA